MRGTIKTPLLLAIVATLLGGYLLLGERDHATTDQARDARRRIFPTLARAAITAIEIDRGEKGRVDLTRGSAAVGDGVWTVGPGGNRASAGAVADLLEAIDDLEIDREATASPDAAGLASPAIQLAIVTATGRLGLDVGSPDATGRSVFVRRAGDPRTLVVGRRLRELVDRDAAAFCERRLFATGIAESATAIAFRSTGSPQRTLRKRGGFWLDDEGSFAARAAIAEALRSLAALEASDFPRRPTTGPEPPPQHVLDLTAGGSTRLEVWAWRHLAALTTRDASDSAVSRTEWLHVNPTAVEHLWRLFEAANQRESHLLPVDPAAADGVILADHDRRLHLRRDGGSSWRFVEPTVPYTADAEVVDAWLARLAALTIDIKLSPPPASESPRHLAIEGAQPAALAVSPPRGKLAHADRIGEVGPITVPAALFADLDPDPLRFRTRTVLTVPRFDVTSIDIRTRIRHVTLRRDASDSWIASDDAHADPTAIDHLLKALADLKADRFLPATAPFIPQTTLDLVLRTGTTTHLDLTSKCHARLADKQIVSLASETCAAVKAAVGP